MISILRDTNQSKYSIISTGYRWNYNKYITRVLFDDLSNFLVEHCVHYNDLYNMMSKASNNKEKS